MTSGNDQKRAMTMDQHEQQLDFYVGMLMADISLRTLLDAIAEGVLFVDDRGRIAFANRAAHEILGHTEGSLTRQPLSSLLPDASVDPHTRHLESFFTSPLRRPMGAGRTFHAKAAGGTVVPVEVSLGHLEVGDGRLGIACFADVSEREAVMDRLRKTNRELEDFAGWVAHDLRSGLTEVAALVADLRGGVDESSAALDDLDGWVTRLADVVAGLLLLARSSRAGGVAVEPIDLNEVMAGVQVRAAPVVDSAGSRLDVDGDLPVVMARRELVAEVLFNLVTNAAVHGGSTIRVGSALDSDGRRAIVVEDDGPGADEHAMSERLARGSRGEAGIGLHIVCSALARLDGRIWYERTHTGGSRFWVWIPEPVADPGAS